MKKILMIGIIAILVALILVSGCTNNQTPTTTINYTVVVPTDAPVAHTVNSVETVRVTSVSINSVGKTGWVKYTSPEDHFSIYKPSDWTVTTISKSELTPGNDVDMSSVMEKFVYVYTPNTKGFIMIYGMDFTGTVSSIFNDPGKTQISDEFYDEFVKGAESATYSNGDNKITINNVEKDSNFYLINGNPARHVRFNVMANGEPLDTDCYIIAHENAYYSEWYLAMTGSTQADATTASNIMKTFTIT